MRKFLLTNDDGIASDGLRRLAEAAARLGEVWIVAPDGQRSASSHSIHLHEPFTARRVEDYPVPGVHAWACSGMPADCVRIGVLNIVPGGPDAVLSGINYGYNAGTDLQYSATAGAAFEAAFQGVHAIALSEHACPDHSVTDRYLPGILAELLEAPLPPSCIWNVNFPGCGAEACRGIARERFASPRESFFRDRYTATPISDTEISFMVQGSPNTHAEPGSDIRALVENYVSLGMVKNIG